MGHLDVRMWQFLDEPSSALDPIASHKIEELLTHLKLDFTIIVTHTMQEAARIADSAAFMPTGENRVGELVEYDESNSLLSTPSDSRTEAYVTGPFGDDSLVRQKRQKSSVAVAPAAKKAK
jgi:phosphate transport system ATP-binding protein